MSLSWFLSLGGGWGGGGGGGGGRGKLFSIPLTWFPSPLPSLKIMWSINYPPIRKPIFNTHLYKYIPKRNISYVYMCTICSTGDDWEMLLNLIHKMVKVYPQVILTTRCSHTPSGHIPKTPSKEHGMVIISNACYLRIVFPLLKYNSPLKPLNNIHLLDR